MVVREPDRGELGAKSEVAGSVRHNSEDETLISLRTSSRHGM